MPTGVYDHKNRKGVKRKPFSAEWRKNLSLAHMGHKKPEKAYKFPKGHKLNEGKTGEKSGHWKGGISFIPEYVSWSKNKRNRLKILAEGKHSTQEWTELKIKYKNTCPCCGKKEPEIKLTKDHIVSLSKGGDDYITNIQPLCGSCNVKKLNKTIKYKIWELS